MKLPRLHLFEIHEQSWLPNILRHYITDFLSFLWCFDGFGTTKSGISPAIELIRKGMGTTKETSIIDLASGSGKAACQVVDQLHTNGHKDIKLTLSDLHPNIEAFELLAKKYPFVSYEKEPVNAASCSIPGCRTFFASFHHFKAETVLNILKDAVKNPNQGIGIFELTDRGLWNLFLLVGIAPFWVFLFTPFIRPFKFSRIILTYIIPIIPLILWWDGIISLFRTYTEDELFAFIKEADPNNIFEWQIKRELCGIARVIALVGYPKQNSDKKPNTLTF